MIVLFSLFLKLLPYFFVNKITFYFNKKNFLEKKNLFTAPDKREEALSYDEFAIGVYKDEKCSLLVGHLPIEISSLSCHFLKKSSENKIIVEITGKREREICLVVPANLFLYL